MHIIIYSENRLRFLLNFVDSRKGFATNMSGNKNTIGLKLN